MHCPKCKEGVLKAHIVADVEVERCPICQGIWFDEDELSTLLKQKKALPLKKQRAEMNIQKGTCPRDGTDLLRVFSKRNRSIIIDLCPVCKGIWLDAGEFQGLTKES